MFGCVLRHVSTDLAIVCHSDTNSHQTSQSANYSIIQAVNKILRQEQKLIQAITRQILKYQDLLENNHYSQC